MSVKVWLSTKGRPVDPEHATLSVFDRGFLYGDSVYETLRTAGGRVVELGAHLDRLRHSAAGIAFELPFTDAEIREALDQTLAAAANHESRVRVIVTRGTGPIHLQVAGAKEPLLVIIVQPLVTPTPEDYAKGISAALIEREGFIRPGLKTGNYLGNLLALHQAQDQGADDAIVYNADGAVAEGATSNLFMVRHGVVFTPSVATGLLAGITRELVMELLTGPLGLELREATIPLDALGEADELFLTSTVRGVMPVTRLEDRVIGDGTAGPITRRLLAAYSAFLAGSETAG